MPYVDYFSTSITCSDFVCVQTKDILAALQHSSSNTNQALSNSPWLGQLTSLQQLSHAQTSHASSWKIYLSSTAALLFEHQSSTVKQFLAWTAFLKMPPVRTKPRHVQRYSSISEFYIKGRCLFDKLPIEVYTFDIRLHSILIKHRFSNR